MSESSRKMLYAIAYEVRQGNSIRPGLQYAHASNAASARFQFMGGMKRVKGLSIVAIAPAVGAHVIEDKKQDRFIL